MSATQTKPTPASPPAGLTARERFIRACRCQAVDRPPIWLMRQAGRALPEYRKLKEKYSFVELVQTPELAAEVTLQPIRRFGFDAAILFSDILVIPEAMGQPYRFRDTGGVVMDFEIRSRADIARLSSERVAERLHYADQALRLVRQQLGDQTGLIGFSGSPWTLATFMMEGGSAKKYSRALALFREDCSAYFELAEKLTQSICVYLELQTAAGVDALQLFDSHGGHLAANEFQEASGRWMRDIISQLSRRRSKESPAIIVFSLGTHSNWEDLVATGADVIGVDWQFSLAEACKRVPATVALQGNLAPALLSTADPAEASNEARRLLVEMRERPGYIFNLGHGLPPDARLENIAAIVELVKQFK